MSTLVIGLGNTLAGDDAAGVRVAEHLRPRTDVEVLVVHALTPELAPAVAASGRVIFVDAAREAVTVDVRPVVPSEDWPACSHALTPADLLALAAALYDRRPPATLVSVPARTFSHGERLSDPTAALVPLAARMIERLL